MNTKVSGMVDALFENVVWSDEVKALHDELMDNCQAHYEDLLHDGKSEEEALAAVKESLSGIDEIIQKYAKKEEDNPEHDDFEHLAQKGVEADSSQEAGDRQDASKHYDFGYPVQEVATVKVQLGATDVFLTRSEDDEVHVIWDDESDPRIDLTCGTLCISVREKKNEENRYEGGILERLRRTFKIGRTENPKQLTITLPEGAKLQGIFNLASGDLTAQGVSLTSLHASSGSGDIKLNDLSCEGDMALKTAAGDVFAQQLTVHGILNVDAVSGDAFLQDGTCQAVNIVSVSGDVRVAGHYQNVQVKSVGGDAWLTLGSEAQSITVKSTSGDILLSLPKEVQKINVSQQSSVSGACCNGFYCGDEGPVVDLKTISGEIHLRHND